MSKRMVAFKKGTERKTKDVDWGAGGKGKGEGGEGCLRRRTLQVKACARGENRGGGASEMRDIHMLQKGVENREYINLRRHLPKKKNQKIRRCKLVERASVVPIPQKRTQRHNISPEKARARRQNKGKAIKPSASGGKTDSKKDKTLPNNRWEDRRNQKRTLLLKSTV